MGFPGGSDGKNICLQWRRPRFDSWVGKIRWRSKWQPTPVLLPGKSHGQKSLVGYSPWGRKELDTTEWLHFHFLVSIWWCPCAELSLVLEKRVCYDQCVLLAFALLHFVLQGQTCLLLQVSLDFLLLHSNPLWWKGSLFGVSSRRSCRSS